jgi:hypothetical protein
MAQVPIDHSIAPRMNSITYYQGGGGAQKGSDDRDPDYTPEQQEVW